MTTTHFNTKERILGAAEERHAGGAIGCDRRRADDPDQKDDVRPHGSSLDTTGSMLANRSTRYAPQIPGNFTGDFGLHGLRGCG
mgnify:CR=1 FL=1